MPAGCLHSPARLCLLKARHIIVVGFSFLALVGAATAAVPAAAGVAQTSLAYPVGEQFTFTATAVGFLPIGTVWMEVTTGSFEQTPTFVFNGRCFGDFKLYLADVRVSSHLSARTDQSLFHCIEQFGSERRGRRLMFDWQSNLVRYVRLERDNVTYKLRREVPVSPDVLDVFGCAFRTRRLFRSFATNSAVEIKVIETERVFHLRAIVADRKPLTVPGIGTFDAARIRFEALNLKSNEVFKGLLDLDKDIQIWVDTSTCTPLYMCSKVPFGIVRPTVEVTLKEWKTVPGFEPVLLKTNTFLPRAFAAPRQE